MQTLAWVCGTALLIASCAAPAEPTSLETTIDAPLDIERLFDEAEALRLAGDTQLALADFKALLATWPEHLDAHRSYQSVRLASGEGDELREEYARLHEELASPWSGYLLARVLFDPVREEALYRAALAQGGDDGYLHRGLGAALAEQRRFDEAVAAYSLAIEREPDSFRAHFARLSAARLAGTLEAYLPLYAEASDPDDERSLALHAAALFIDQRPVEAAALVERCLEREAPSEELLGVALMVFFQLEDWVAVEDLLQRATALAPHESRLLVVGGTYHRLVRDDPAGLASIVEGVRLDPFNGLGYAAYAAALLADDDLDGALKAAETALQRNPNETVALALLTQFALWRGEVELARAYADSRLEVEPEAPEAWSALAIVLDKARELEAAEEARARAASLRAEASAPSPVFAIGSARLLDGPTRDAERLCGSARFALFDDRPDQAVEHLNQVLEALPDHPDALWLLGRIRQHQGRSAEALELFRRLEELGSHAWIRARAALRAADCLYALGERAAALDQYRRVAEEYAEWVSWLEGVEAIVAAMTDENNARESLVVPDLRPSSCLEDKYCVPVAMTAVLGHWGVDCDVLELGRELGSEDGTWCQDVVDWSAARDDLDLVVFLADRDAIKNALRLGFPPILLYPVGIEDKVVGHASVVRGFDDDRGVVLLEDSNWCCGPDQLPYGALDGLRALLLAPAGRAAELAPFEGIEYCTALGLAEQLLAEGAPKEADVGARAAIEERPEIASAHALQGRIHLRTQQVEAALEAYGRAVESVGAHAGSWTAYGEMLLRRDRRAEAAEAFEHAAALEPRYLRPRIALARLRLESEDYDAAERIAEELDSLAHWNADVRVIRGRALLARGRVEAAMQEFRAAGALGETRHSLWFQAFGHTRLGEYQAAIDAMEQFEEANRYKGAQEAAEKWIEVWERRLHEH